MRLQYIGFEEGRIRVMQSVSEDNGYDFVTIEGNMVLPDGKQGAIDYYIRDYQQNVRMILTEETHIGSNQATMETARAAGEEALFGQTGGGNEVAATRFPVADIPGQSIQQGWNNPNIQSNVSRLGNLAAKKTGPNALLKVMAGDEISSYTDYYYKDPVTNGTGNNLVSSVLGSLISAISGSAVATPDVKDATTNINNNLNSNAPFADAVAPDANNPNGNNPKAYLNILFFNERFEFVEEGSTALRVQGAGNGQEPLFLNSIKAPKNGYCFVYLSNESDEHVYFDNFRVTHNRKHIIEENHYYAYGLKIAAISSRKVGDAREGHLDNLHLYNNKELIDDADLGWYDYGFRNYDPQIGRFPQLDPLTHDYPFLTPFQYASCDPITNIDIDGLEGGGSTLATVFITTKAPATVNTGPSLMQLLATPKIFAFTLYAEYTNSRGHTFVERGNFNVQPAKSVSYLGEDWEYTGTRMEGAYHDAPYTGPTFQQGSPDAFKNSIPRKEGVFDDSYILSKARQWNRERIAARNHGFPIFDNLFGGMNYLGAGETGEGLKRIGYGGVETASSMFPVTRLGALVPRGGQIWSSTSRLSSVQNAFKHWKDHGAEFPNLLNSKQYVEATKNFLQNSPSGTLMKTRINGDILKYNSSTNTFGVMNSLGVPRTMFKPTDGMQYWLRQ